MKKAFSIITVIASVLPVLADSPMTSKAVITGHTTAIQDSTEVFLYQWEGDLGTLLGRDTVINKQFRFEIPDLTEVKKTEILTLAPGFPSMGRTLYVAPGAEVEIEGHDHLILTWPVRSNVKEQAEFDRYLLNNKDLWEEYQHYGIARSVDRNAGKRFSEMRDSISRIIDKREISYLKSAPVTELWLDLFATKARFIKTYSEESAAGIRAIFEGLDDSVKFSAKGEKIRNYLYPGKELAIGDMMPDTPLFDIDGNEHHFRDFLGKWILVDIWSTGCGPCIMAMPELNELKQNKTDDYEIISLSIDGEDGWRSGTAQFNVQGWNLNEGVEDRGIYSRLPWHAVPSFLIISPEGIIRDMWSGHSKGEYARKIRFYTRKKAEPTYTESEGLRIITDPEYESNTTRCILDIARIETGDKGTTIHFNLDYVPKNWITISPNSFLSTPDGSKYAITGSEGITPGKHCYADEEGKGSFSITFEPLPLSVNEFDFIEDDYSSEWSIKGIRIGKP